jgi:hypothetical protein
MSSIEPIDSTRLEPVQRVRPPVRRDRRDPDQQQSRDEPGKREPDEREETAGGGLVDVRV